MGLGSLCQRTLLRVESRRRCLVTTLLPAILLFSVVGFVVFHSPNSPTNSFSSMGKQSRSGVERLDVFVVSPSKKNTFHRDTVVRKEWTTSVVNTVRQLHNEDLSQKKQVEGHFLKKLDVPMSIDKDKHLAGKLEKVVPEKHKKSRSRPFSVESGVFSPKDIRIVPVKPVLREGSLLFLNCVVAGYRPNDNHDAPYLNFELPEMPYELENNVTLTTLSGILMLRVEVVKKGHEGVYKCYSLDQSNELKYNTVEVRVIERDEDGRSDVRRQTRQRQSFLSEEKNEDLSSLLESGKIQERRVDSFCESHNLTEQALRLPGDTDRGSGCLYRHLLLNDKTNTMFCFVPKAGCTNLRLLFFVTQGLIPRSQLLATRDMVNQEMLEGVQYAQSFASRSNTQRKFALNRYFKFMMYRNPLERLLSGYRSKVERFPLIGLDDDRPHYNWLRKEVHNATHPLLYEEYVRTEGAKGVNISFSDFIDFWLTRPESLKIDEHFRSIFSLCQPCRVRFNFYGNFKNFNTDSQVLIHKIHSSPKFLRQGYYTSVTTTGALTQRYYSQLSQTQRLNIVELLRLDLDFYYHLFPDEEANDKLFLSL